MTAQAALVLGIIRGYCAGGRKPFIPDIVMLADLRYEVVFRQLQALVKEGFVAPSDIAYPPVVLEEIDRMRREAAR